MRSLSWVFCVGVVMLLSGCKTLSDSIEQRMEVSERCNAILTAPPAQWDAHTHIASIYAGNVGYCDFTLKEQLLPMCSFTQIRTKFSIAPPLDKISLVSDLANLDSAADALRGRLPTLAASDKSDKAEMERQAQKNWDAALAALKTDLQSRDRVKIWTTIGTLETATRNLGASVARLPSPPDLQIEVRNVGSASTRLRTSLIPILGQESLAARLDGIDSSVEEFRSTLTTLADKLKILDNLYIEALQKFNSDSKNDKAQDRINKLREINDEVLKIRPAVAAVHVAHEKLKQDMDALAKALPETANEELSAWDSNLRIQLSQLEQLLSGNLTIVFNAGLRDQVVSHVARRSLELLHGSLKAANAVLNRLDDKAYGAVSVSYLAFGPKIQTGINQAFDNIKSSYGERVTPVVEERERLTKIFLKEMQRAACDNLTQGTQFSMLTELVDTMLILQVDKETKNVKAAGSATTSARSADANKETNPKAAPGANLPSHADLPLRQTKLILRAASSPQAPAELDATAATPSSTSPASPLAVYAVNEWMARQQLLVEKLRATRAARGGNDAIDAGLVKQLADSATAKSIDDATRLDPSMLVAEPPVAGENIQGAVNVAAAATAVAQASAVLKLNLSVSNVNTFSPTNYNNVAPVIMVAPSGGLPANASALTPCAAIDFGAAGISCADEGDVAVLGFTRSNFRSDSCVVEDIEPALSMVGSMLRDYRARAGVDYTATVQGYASLPAATLAACRRKISAVPACGYVNGLRKPIVVDGCASPRPDRNRLLSAQRALVAARRLEEASNGAVIVGEVQARGTETAVLRGSGAPVDVDQTVIIRLMPRMK